MRKIASEVKKQINKTRIEHALKSLNILDSDKNKPIDLELINQKIDKLIILVSILLDD